MESTIRILIQTTTPARPDDWSVDSLTLLRGHLAGLSEEGVRLEVTARNRGTPAGTSDPVLSRLDETDFDEPWLFALDSAALAETADEFSRRYEASSWAKKASVWRKAS